jgi:hypothetical protein
MESSAGDSDDRSHDGASGPGKRSSPLGELSVDRIRSLSADPMREALLGGLPAVGVALVQIVSFYVLLLIRWAVGAGDTPGMGGWSISSPRTEGRCSRRCPLLPRFLA